VLGKGVFSYLRLILLMRVYMLDAHQIPPRRRRLWNREIPTYGRAATVLDEQIPVLIAQGPRVRDLEPIAVAVPFGERDCVRRFSEVDLSRAFVKYARFVGVLGLVSVDGSVNVPYMYCT
jgi:hypothetical protein